MALWYESEVAYLKHYSCLFEHGIIKIVRVSFIIHCWIKIVLLWFECHLKLSTQTLTLKHKLTSSSVVAANFWPFLFLFSCFDLGSLKQQASSILNLITMMFYGMGYKRFYQVLDSFLLFIAAQFLC